MESTDWHEAHAALAWQVELGADEAILDAPVDRFALEAPAPKPSPAARRSPATAPPASEDAPDAVALATAAAGSANDLPSLRAAMEAFEACPLKSGARQLVFSDGVAGAPIMVVGEAPGRDEDREGRPFVGRAGQLLDRMLQAIDCDRSRNVYITNIIPWRPPQNRDPSAEEIAMMMPFVSRHIALARPKVIVAMGNISCQALLGKRGITRLRGVWDSYADVPLIPMFHPAYLLRQPHQKRAAWSDLLELKAKLAEVAG